MTFGFGFVMILSLNIDKMRDQQTKFIKFIIADYCEKFKLYTRNCTLLVVTVNMFPIIFSISILHMI